MTGSDLQKVRAWGFRVFSKDMAKMTITESEYGVVKKYGGPYKTKAELNRAWEELMQDPKHISR